MVEILFDLISLFLQTLGRCLKLLPMICSFWCWFRLMIGWSIIVVVISLLSRSTVPRSCLLIVIGLLWFLVDWMHARTFRVLGAEKVVLSWWRIPNLFSNKAVLDNLLYAFFFAIMRSKTGITSITCITRAYDYILIEHFKLSIRDILVILKMVWPILVKMSLLVACVKPLMRALIWINYLMSSQWISFIVLKIIMLLHWACIIWFLN